MASVKIAPIHPSLGAEMAGVDLSAPLDEPTRRALTRRWPITWRSCFTISR